MTALLGWVPVLASFSLGVAYLWHGDGGEITKAAGVIIFVLAVYLQFFSAYATAGVLLQCALAFTLEMWRRLT